MASPDGREDELPTTASVLAPFERDVLGSTGRAIRVRPAMPHDLDGLRAFYDGLGETSTYFRFFSFRPFVPDHELQRATVHDIHDRVTLVAEAAGTIVGTGEYCRVPGHRDDAEVAFAVADAHHHEGIATVLLEDLAVIARAAGFRRLVAETLPGNQAMQGVFGAAGLVHRSWFEDGVVRVQLDLTVDDLMQDDAALRDWRAAVRSLRPLLQPSHVVVIGAGRDPASPGRRILAHMRDSFHGTVSVVHPTEHIVGGVDAVERIDQIDGVPDLAVVAVPAAAAIDVVDQCGAAGVPMAVVISAGFAETGDEGARRQDELLAVARRHGMRIVGPNCLGVVSTPCGLDATFTSQTFQPGGIAIASQSGGVGIAIAAEAQRRHAGISSFVSMGNKVDVSGNDLLRLWADDPNTNVMLLYLESFGDPVRFARVARSVSQRKPVVAVKSGRSTPGRRGAASHTAALATDQAIVDALFAHTGVMRARTLEELIDVGLLLDRQPAPAGRRIAVLGNAGGPLILAADAADAGGLDVPVLSAKLQNEIAGLVPGAAATVNPVDLAANVTPAQLAGVVQVVVRSGEIDACVVVGVQLDGRLDQIGPLLAAIAVDGIPLAISLIGGRDEAPLSLPTFPTPERAVAALALAAARSDWQASIVEERDTPSTVDPASFAEARRLARRHAGSGPTWLDPATAFRLLEVSGVPIAPWEHADSAEACARAVDRLGGPCAIKADVAELVHKSDSDAVRLGVDDSAAAAATYVTFERRFQDRLKGVVVQAQQAAGVELLVGVIRDAAFGPLLVVGDGGIDAELRDDQVVLIAPASRPAVRRALENLRIAPLFHGFRGRPALPIDEVVEVIHRVGILAATTPEVRQLDVNPVLVRPDGCVAVDALIAVAAVPSPVVPPRGLRGHAAPGIATRREPTPGTNNTESTASS